MVCDRVSIIHRGVLRKVGPGRGPDRRGQVEIVATNLQNGLAEKIGPRAPTRSSWTPRPIITQPSDDAPWRGSWIWCGAGRGTSSRDAQAPHARGHLRRNRHRPIGAPAAPPCADGTARTAWCGARRWRRLRPRRPTPPTIRELSAMSTSVGDRPHDHRRGAPPQDPERVF
jgi:hypothetical protein